MCNVINDNKESSNQFIVASGFVKFYGGQGKNIYCGKSVIHVCHIAQLWCASQSHNAEALTIAEWKD